MHKMELVTWNDPEGNKSWFPLDKANTMELAEVKSIGWIIFEDEDRLILVQSIDIKNKMGDNSITLNKKMITSRVELRRK